MILSFCVTLMVIPFLCLSPSLFYDFQHFFLTFLVATHIVFYLFLCLYFFSFQVDLRHIDELNGTNVVEVGVDLSEFYTSVEWDILEVPAVR